MYGRLELILNICESLKKLPASWDWQTILNDFITPCLGHAHKNIRDNAVKIGQFFVKESGQDAILIV